MDLRSREIRIGTVRARILEALTWSGISVVYLCVLFAPWAAGFNDDAGVFAYLAAGSGKGQILYRDLFSQHAPVHLWLSGLAFRLGGPEGLAVQGLLLSAALTGLIGWAGGEVARRARSSMLARNGALAILWATTTVWTGFSLFLSCGGRPQMTASLLVLAGVLALARERHLLSGFLLAGACFSWQPAAVIAVGAGIGAVVARGRKRERSGFRVGLRVFLGVSLCGTVVVAILAVQGALSAFLHQAVMFPLQAAEVVREDLPTVVDIPRFLPLPHLVFAVLGLIWGLLSFFLRRKRDRPLLEGRATSSILRASLWGWLITYFALLFLRFDGRGDLMPLLVPLGILAGVFVIEVGSGLGGKPGRVLGGAKLAIGLAICSWLALDPDFHERWPPREAQAAKCDLFSQAAGDRGLLIFADPVLQLLTDAPAFHPYVYWEPGTLDVLRDEPGGAEAFVKRLLDRDYGLIVVGKRAHGLIPLLEGTLGSRYTDQVPLFRRDRKMWMLTENE